MYEPARDQLDRWRGAVDDDVAMASLRPLLDAASDAGYALSRESALRTAPRGWPRDHRRIELLRLRSVTVARTHEPGEWLLSRRCLDVVAAGLDVVEPLNGWLDDRIGPPREGDG